MKPKTFKRALAFCIGGVMALSLAACGNSADKDEEITQETTQESEDENIGLVINDEDADPAGNDMAAIPVSASSNGNGSTAPIFKPGAEPQPGQELKPGEEPQPDEEPKPSAGTQKPQSNTGAQTGTGSQQFQQPQPDSGTQPSTGPQQSQQAQQPQPSQPGAGTQTSGGTQSGTGTQTAHTHNFKGGNCSTPATCSCGATGDYGSHNWVTSTIHHDATGHYESRTTTELVITGYTPKTSYYWCDQCLPPKEISDFYDHYYRTLHMAGTRYRGGDPIYEEQTVTKDVWVEDTAAWDEKVIKCSICDARQ